jgi:hypothetical protein
MARWITALATLDYGGTPDVDLWPAADKEEAGTLAQLLQDEEVDGLRRVRIYTFDLEAEGVKTAADKIRQLMCDIAEREKD